MRRSAARCAQQLAAPNFEMSLRKFPPPGRRNEHSRLSTQRYVVKPRQDGRGFELSGPGLPFTVRYVEDIHAVAYAHWHGGGKGGKIHVLDSRGHCILTETIEASGQGTLYGPQAGEFAAAAPRIVSRPVAPKALAGAPSPSTGSVSP